MIIKKSRSSKCLLAAFDNNSGRVWVGELVSDWTLGSRTFTESVEEHVLDCTPGPRQLKKLCASLSDGSLTIDDLIELIQDRDDQAHELFKVWA